eukprot:maker-scaffold_20-snap-gene-5.5-mRNA-1 protein AED:0.07 eAED:0.68 QI:56/0/0.5/1/0/0/2/0/308
MLRTNSTRSQFNEVGERALRASPTGLSSPSRLFSNLSRTRSVKSNFTTSSPHAVDFGRESSFVSLFLPEDKQLATRFPMEQKIPDFKVLELKMGGVETYKGPKAVLRAQSKLLAEMDVTAAELESAQDVDLDLLGSRKGRCLDHFESFHLGRLLSVSRQERNEKYSLATNVTALRQETKGELVVLKFCPKADGEPIEVLSLKFGDDAQASKFVKSVNVALENVFRLLCRKVRSSQLNVLKNDSDLATCEVFARRAIDLSQIAAGENSVECMEAVEVLLEILEERKQDEYEIHFWQDRLESIKANVSEE